MSRDECQAWKNPNLESGPDGQSLPIRLARETSSFIEASKDGPFFAYLSFYSVHAPIQTTPALWKKYREKALAAGLVKERFGVDRRICVRQVQDCPVYAGMIESMDDAVGIVLSLCAKKRNSRRPARRRLARVWAHRLATRAKRHVLDTGRLRGAQCPPVTN